MYLISDLQMKAGIHQGFQMEGRGDRASGGWLSFAPTSSHCCLLWMPPRLVQWEERGRNEGRRKKKVRRGRQPESQGGKQNKGEGPFLATQAGMAIDHRELGGAHWKLTGAFSLRPTCLTGTEDV